MNQYHSTPESNYAQGMLDNHYVKLKKWALKITENNREMSEDIVHDIFLRLQSRSANLDEIKDLNAYLYTTVKNEYLSHLRKQQPQQLSFFEEEISNSRLFSTDPRQQLEFRDDLRAVCQYLCRRKETSKSAGILILRFFHGYSIDEIALILNTSRNNIEARFLAVRRDLRVFFDTPNLDADGSTSAKSLGDESLDQSDDIVFELRERIFETRVENCPAPERFREVYGTIRKSFTRQTLSHLVSCRNCLEFTNRLHSIPGLNERHPFEDISKVRKSFVSKAMAAGARAIVPVGAFWNNLNNDLTFVFCQF
jgi:RNA polymerase sigma factor (sigma-70 family)